jgi:hypothetical protein
MTSAETQFIAEHVRDGRGMVLGIPTEAGTPGKQTACAILTIKLDRKYVKSCG